MIILLEVTPVWVQDPTLSGNSLESRLVASCTQEFEHQAARVSGSAADGVGCVPPWCVSAPRGNRQQEKLVACNWSWGKSSLPIRLRELLGSQSRRKASIHIDIFPFQSCIPSYRTLSLNQPSTIYMGGRGSNRWTTAEIKHVWDSSFWAISTGSVVSFDGVQPRSRPSTFSLPARIVANAGYVSSIVYPSLLLR